MITYLNFLLHNIRFRDQGRYWHDKVCRTEQQDFAVGDLLIGRSDMFLVLWDEVVWKADKAKCLLSEPLNLHHKWFFSKKTINLVHWLTHHYYTSYKNVVKLFVSWELADLFKKEITVKPKKAEQSLIIYPDVRTMENLIEQVDQSEKWTLILNGTSTQVQKDKAWRWIKMGSIHTLYCTYSQIFQDRRNLQHITLFDSHQWYYKSQQDPRYDAREVAKKLSEIYEANLTMKWVNIFGEQ